MRWSRSLVWLAYLSGIILLSAPLAAQEQSVSLTGIVRDTSGVALPGVVVTVASSKGVTLSASTDNQGWYRFAAVPPGTWTITAELGGMDTARAENVRAPLGSSKTIDFVMKLSTLAESITVTVPAPIVDVTSSASSAVVTSDQLEVLPLGRDIQSAVALAAGANAEALAGGISINGASGSENVWVVDGVNVTHPLTGTVGMYMRNDFVDEIQVKSAGYMAEFGGATGGVINALTKTGGNDVAGSVNLYYESERLNGDLRPALVPDFWDETRYSYEYYDNDNRTMLEPGLAFGGPIVRNEVWFFGAYQPQIQTIDRTVTFDDGVTDTFTQDFRRDASAASLSGAIGAKLLWKGVYNTAGTKQENLLPSISVPESSAQADYVGRIDKRTLWTATAYADYMATSNLAVSLYGGRYLQNFENEGYPANQRYFFIYSSCAFLSGDLCKPRGYRSPANNAVSYDQFTRDNVHLELSWFPSLAGSHSIKLGTQQEILRHEVMSGPQAPQYRVYWGTETPWWDAAHSGPFGQAGVYEFIVTGDVKDSVEAYFLQDSWTTLNNRLTLNFGVRAESERVPGYAHPELGLPTHAIEFDYSDKVAPRFGFAYDVRGDGRWRAYGSYGVFYDTMKLQMPLASLGGGKWIWHNFAIIDPLWTEWTCTNPDWTSLKSIPSCSDHLEYIGSIDLVAPGYDLIEPNLEPMESVEYSIGTEYEISPIMSAGLRYIHKELIRTIEDVGVCVAFEDGCVETFFQANPGFGVATHIMGEDFPVFPKAVRDYDAIDLTFTKRFANNWSLHASYVYSRLYGNYSGLASSDEIFSGWAVYGVAAGARTSPNILRYGDSLFSQFDASGSREPVMGRLGTDRPHQLKFQGSYAFPFGTTVSLNQYVGSGTPKSTTMFFENVTFFPFGRGDLGRTPTLTQTDLFVAHQFRVRGDQSIELGVNVLNLFDEDTPVYYFPYYQRNYDVEVSAQEFFEGFDPFAATVEGDVDPLFNQPQYFQAPREVRFHVKYRF